MRHCLIQRGVLRLTFFCKAMRRVHCPTLRGKAMYPSTLNCIHPSSVFHSKVILLKGIENCSAAWCKGLRASLTTSLEPVCCKKRQEIVPDQLLVWGVGDL